MAGVLDGATYIDAEEFTSASYVSDETVGAVEAARPGFIRRALAMRSAEINARLAKRYEVPLGMVDPPALVVRWLVDLVSYDVMMAIGFDPSSAQDSQIVKRYETALEQMREAADAAAGLYELPPRLSENATAVRRGGPLFARAKGPYELNRRRRGCR